MAVAIPIIAGVAGSLTSSFVAAAVGGGTFGAIIGGIAGAVVSFGVSYAGSKIFGKEPDKPKFDPLPLAADIKGGGRTQMVRQPITSHRIVYGETRVSGPVVFIHSRPISVSSEKLDILHVVIVLAAHEAEAIDDIYFNENVIALDGNGDATEEP